MTDFEDKTVRNYRSNNAVAPAVENRSGISRRTTLLALMTATAVAAAAVLVKPAGAAEPVASGFVYTADEEDGSISRIDLSTGKVETFPVAIAPHNVQFVPATGRLLAVGAPRPAGGEGGSGHSDDHSKTGGMGEMDMDAGGKLIALDTANLASGPIASIPAGAHPAHVIADPDGNRAFVTDSEHNIVSVIDLTNGAVIATVPTGDYPHGLRMSPDGRFIYVANVKDGTVSVLDAVKLTEVARIKVGQAPVQVGFTPDGSRVYVSLRDENKVAVINTSARQEIERTEVGRSPIQVHATPDGRFIFVANQGTEAKPNDTVSVINVASGKVVKTIRTGLGAHGVAVSNDSAFVFVTNILDGTVSLISVKNQSVLQSYVVGKGPNGITFQAPLPTPGSAG
ncbi:cytochrome D1 domain-containing protein [Mesorhizobium sp. WSM4976]|uniref:YVTN family beta-propeller repeat protein n=1 Tax=Mesorhizobium sp. WSM4976 TaxID=3038549 RepID=UPI002415B0E0|nr:cytochrome D1 domain-containing protein [Mesorhizobium sp. WSM4976]MDG4893621.1 cytochrome D1 domain-containing protein [Mesorhizobium sp. WSM4976]